MWRRGKLGPMQYLLSITAFVIFLTSSSLSIAAVSCREQQYETLCKKDSSCEWDDKKSKCKTKQAHTGCTSHSEFYCQANGCQWDLKGRKCETKGTGKTGPD
jgi:hypothetical protein